CREQFDDVERERGAAEHDRHTERAAGAGAAARQTDPRADADDDDREAGVTHRTAVQLSAESRLRFRTICGARAALSSLIALRMTLTGVAPPRTTRYVWSTTSAQGTSSDGATITGGMSITICAKSARTRSMNSRSRPSGGSSSPD